MTRSWLSWTVVLLGVILAPQAFGHGYAPDELLVGFRPGTAPAVRSTLHRSLGAVVLSRVPQLDLEVVSLPPGSDLYQVAERYVRHAEVVCAEPDLLFSLDGSPGGLGRITSTALVPSDPAFAQQWGLTKIQAPLAWNITQGRPGIAIAILDSGIAANHNDLAGKTVASNTLSISPTADDLFGQGTHLAGIAAAISGNGVGVAGLAPGCSLMNVKVARDDGKSLASWLAEGITWAADNGAKVICMGVGSPVPSQIVEKAVNYAWERDVVLVASAGSDGRNAPTYPAAYENCIAVASTDPSDGKAGDSGWGPWVDVAAPGVGILSTLPNGANAFRQQGYGTVSGTSQAAAFVAGLAGLVWSAGGGSNAGVRARIESTCDAVAGTGSLWVHGRINAARAVGAIQ